MVRIISELRRDHRNTAKLLEILERELAAFDQTERPDYEILSALADYLGGYAAVHHHPLEDAVFRRLRAVDPDAAAAVGDQLAEHDILAELTGSFAETIESIVNEAELPRAAFHDSATALLKFYRHHMAMEESVFFPAALEKLTAGDWERLETEIADQSEVAANKTKESSFERLRNQIMEWEGA